MERDRELRTTSVRGVLYIAYLCERLSALDSQIACLADDAKCDGRNDACVDDAWWLMFAKSRAAMFKPIKSEKLGKCYTFVRKV